VQQPRQTLTVFRAGTDNRINTSPCHPDARIRQSFVRIRGYSMMPDEPGAPALDPAGRLSVDFETRLRGMMGELLEAARDERIAAAREARELVESDAAKTLTTELSRVRAEAAEMLATELARARAEIRQSVAAEVALARAQADENAAGEIARIRADAAQALAAAVTKVQADAAELLRKELGVAEESTRNAIAELTAVRLEERHATLATLDRLVINFRRLDRARSLTDVLDELAGAASEEAARVAIVVVQGRDVRVWRVVGFGSRTIEAGASDVVPAAGLVGHAIDAAETCVAPGHSADNGSGLSFAGLSESSAAVAVPIRVGEKVVAVVYADDLGGADGTDPASWPAAVELLARHAARCLELITARRSAHQGRIPKGVSDRPSAGTNSRIPSERVRAEDAARQYARKLVADVTESNGDPRLLGYQRRD
jgi:hypothetical protein